MAHGGSVDAFVQQAEHRFYLVLVIEEMQRSLVLLRRRLHVPLAEVLALAPRMLESDAAKAESVWSDPNRF